MFSCSHVAAALGELFSSKHFLSSLAVFAFEHDLLVKVCKALKKTAQGCGLRKRGCDKYHMVHGTLGLCFCLLSCKGSASK